MQQSYSNRSDRKTRGTTLPAPRRGWLHGGELVSKVWVNFAVHSVALRSLSMAGSIAKLLKEVVHRSARFHEPLSFMSCLLVHSVLASMFASYHAAMMSTEPDIELFNTSSAGVVNLQDLSSVTLYEHPKQFGPVTV